MLPLERESTVGLHGSTVVGERRNLARAWIGDARRKSRGTQLVIGQTKAWMVQEIRGIHANLEVGRFPLGDIEDLAER